MKWLVTGSGSGFGLAIARMAVAAGHRVVATDPHPERVDVPGADVVRLDVCSASDVAATARAHPDVDVVVNNAGVGVFATQEEADLDAVRRLFDVNVLGVARVNQAFLPAIRARRGTVVFLSSIAGRMAFPESGFYAASKHAVEAMAEALFEETCTFGVRVRLVEPGSFATRFQEHAAALSGVPPEGSPYADLRALWTRRREAVLPVAQPPELVAAAVLASVADPAAFARVPVGPDADRILGLRTALSPDAWVRLSAERHGFSGRDPGDVPSEEAVAAARAGHLDHWRETDAGRAALARLDRLGRPPQG